MNKHAKEERARRRMIEEMVDYEMGGLSFDQLWENEFGRRVQEYQSVNPKELQERYEEYFGNDEA